MKLVRTLVVAATVLGASTVLGVPASAAPPTGGGCSPAFKLRTVESLQEEAQTPAGDAYLASADKNGDGYLCNRYAPDAASLVGIAYDNSKKIRG